MARAITTGSSSASNTSLGAAKRAKNDEFYTQLTDIEKELHHYKDHFKGKVVFCNCDDPEWSNFWKYFTLNFEHLGLARVVATHYAIGGPSYKLEYFGAGMPMAKTALSGDGDFRSSECEGILKEADIVVTNPPFSLFREYVAQLIEHNKKFVIIGSRNAITYKEIFKLVKEDKFWLGYGFTAGNAYFKTPYPKEFAKGVYDEETGLVKFRNVTWATNLDIQKRHEPLVLYKSFAECASEYPAYDNYDAIEVSKVSNIPCDYAGCMGVPITFLDKHNPAQFKIVGLAAGNIKGLAGIPSKTGKHGPYIGGKLKYGRILIQRKTQEIEGAQQ